MGAMKMDEKLLAFAIAWVMEEGSSQSPELCSDIMKPVKSQRHLCRSKC